MITFTNFTFPQGRPSIEIVFSQSLQVEGPKEAYRTTWLPAEGSELWVTWILKDFPDACILLVSYDAFAQKSSAVFDRAQVQVMLESNGFSMESCVIVTSRENRFLLAENFEGYFVEELDQVDSKRILCLNAFGKEIAKPGNKLRVAKVTKTCGGLPLALRVAGKHLHERKEGVWDEGLEKLRHANATQWVQRRWPLVSFKGVLRVARGRRTTNVLGRGYLLP